MNQRIYSFPPSLFMLRLAAIISCFFLLWVPDVNAQIGTLTGDIDTSMVSTTQAEFVEGYAQHFSLTEGMPSNQVYDSYQDIHGNIWFTTDRGVVKYNGSSMEIFTTKNGLANTVNFDFFKGTGEVFWLNGLNNTLSYWDGKKFNPFAFNDSLHAHSGEDDLFINIISMDKEGIDYILSRRKKCILEEHYFRINKTTGKISPKKFQREQRFTDGVNNRLKYLLTVRNILRSLPDEEQEYLTREFTKVHPSNVLIPINTALTLWKHSSDFNFAFQGEDSTFWVIGSTGAYNFKTKHLNRPPTIFFKGRYITSILEDKEKGYWFTSQTDGVFYLPSNVVNGINSGTSDLRKNTYKLEATPNYLIAGRKEDILFMDTSLFVRCFAYSSETNRPLVFKAGENSYKVLARECMFEIDNNEIKSSKLSIPGNKYILSDGRILLYDYSIKVGPSYDDGSHKEGEGFKRSSRISALLEGSESDIWIGTYDGLYKKDIGQISSFFEHRERVLPYRITDLETDPGSGHLWVSSLTHGLFFRYSDSLGPVDIPTLNEHTIHCLYLEGDSLIWVGTNHGLFKIQYRYTTSLEVTRLQHFTTLDGIISNYINDIAEWNGFMWLSTNIGICRFHRNELHENTRPPFIELLSLSASNQTYPLTKPLPDFEHDESDIHIAYQGVSFRKPLFQQPFYRYSLNFGTNKKWVYTSEHEQYFNNLNPGNYTFTIQCKTQNGIWSTPQKLSFVVKAPFYKTLGFIGVSFVILLFLISWGITVAIRLKQKRLQTQLRIKEAELYSLVNQMNPHFIFNTLNSIQSFVVNNEKESASEYLGQLSRLMQKSLEQTKDQYITLEEEVKFIREYLKLEVFRSGNSLNFEVDVLSELKEIKRIVLPAFIVQPIVENSIKHAFKKNGPDKKLIKVSYKPDLTISVLRIKIEDNGSGFYDSGSKASQRRSFGLKIVRERLELMMEMKNLKENFLQIESGNSSGNLKGGTIITLTIPINLK